MTSAQPSPGIEAVELYWRRGCGFCSALRRRLERLGIPFIEHDIWADPNAAARVRAAARGSETVPTVGIGPAMLVNPRVAEVVRTLETVAPNLVPSAPPADTRPRRLRDRLPWRHDR